MRPRCAARVSAPSVLRLAGASLLTALLVLECQRGEARLDRWYRQRSGAGVTKKDREEYPLYLTPYVVQGRVRDGRERSRVGPIDGSPDIESYAGFLTVREHQLNHLFFWFFPAIKKHSGSAAPLLLWLQGGPGAPSMMGALVEHGPLRAAADGTATFRAHTWAQEASVVYVDQPVGTGFSHSHDGVDNHWYCANASDAAADLYEFMGQFCVIFAAECHRADFFIAAESYAAKFAIALATMMKMMRDEDSLPRLSGLVLASPFVDPENQLDNSELLHQTGFLTDVQAALLWEQYNRVARLIRRGNYTAAKDLLEDIIDGNPTVSTTLFGNLTGLRQAYDLDLTYSPAIFTVYEEFVDRAEVRRALHVGRRLVFMPDGDAVTHSMYADILVSYKHQLADLLDQDLKVLLYGGQKDLITPFSSVERFMKTLSWKGQMEYATTPRLPWRLGTDQVLGYYRHVHNYTEVLVRGAGHVTAFDKPKEVLALVTRFIYGAPIDDAR
ncbi:probable serine carboxypeptidase CPVL isoform X1 [Dermacentor albipictus]|uniref:probable serine carboxypeptidase CPVL isoform X1 n=2 Tax=Dermacentor albipictus TaxID=60249 RepID=UPI0031FD3026